MNPAILLLVLAIVACSADACLHNATHCQCTTVPAGGNCMMHVSGSGSNAVCDIYPCGEGVVCDCLGDQLCAISSCASENIYRPLSPVRPGQTGSVACELAPRGEGTCVNAIGPLPPSPSATPLPIASAGESCSLPSLTCAPGLTCLCGNDRCVQDRVSLDIRAIGDDSITIYSCDGGEIGAIPNVFTTGSMRYEGMCQDLIVVVRNVGGLMALSLAVTHEGVTYVSGRDLPMVVAGGPVDGYLQCCNYDYSSFEASVQAGDANRGVYLDFGNANNGAVAQSISGPGLANTDYVFRVTLPFCTQPDVVLPTPSPQPSFVPAPSASPLAVAGESCASLECAAGLTCRCDDDVCVPTVEFDIHAIGDDVVTIYTCSGGEIGNIPLVHRIDTFRHVGMCEDLIVVVRNNLLEVGLAIAVTYEGVVYATGNNLPVSVAQNPPDGFLNCCNYDFSPFQEPRLLTEHIGVSVFTGYINFANAYNGGRPVTFPSSTFLSNTDYVFRVSLPFCPPSLAAAPAAA